MNAKPSDVVKVTQNVFDGALIAHFKGGRKCHFPSKVQTLFRVCADKLQGMREDDKERFRELMADADLDQFADKILFFA